MTTRDKENKGLKRRKIIHIDMDCFYAAIEMRDNPRLRGQPIAVGGDAYRRGVIATCNYEARQWGIHSAMPTAKAQKCCPALIVLPVNMEKYQEVAEGIRKIFLDYTALVEPLSLDEAYLDVSETTLHQGSATLMAKAIKERIVKEQGLTASAGVAPNKLLAKIASDWRKPNGLFVITPDDVASFMVTLPVGKLWGVGKVTREKLNRQGIYHCEHLSQLSLFDLTKTFGAYGQQLYYLCRGIDERQVTPHREAKSVSVEHTFLHDLQTQADCRAAIEALLPQLLVRAEKHKTKPMKTQFLKMTFSDFTHTTVERRFQALSTDVFYRLFEEGYARQSLPIRLLGIGVGFAPAQKENVPVQSELPV